MSEINDLPGHVGRETDPETGYALVCTATRRKANPWTDPICGTRATHHIRWQEATTDNGFACADHLEFAREFDPFDLHPVTDSACGMPGAWWVPGDPWSYCTLLALAEEPERAGAALIGAAP